MTTPREKITSLRHYIHDEVFLAATTLCKLANSRPEPSAISDSDSTSGKQSGKRKVIMKDGSPIRSHKKLNRSRNMDTSGKTTQLDDEVTSVANLSISVIKDLMSAIRAALITSVSRGYFLSLESPSECSIQGNSEKQVTNSISNKEIGQNNLPYLGIHQIVEHLGSKVGDVFILEYGNLFPEMVKEVLKVLSLDREALRMTMWTPLVEYDRTRKQWRWTGPKGKEDHIYNMVNISATGWGISEKNLKKLVNKCLFGLKRVLVVACLMESLPSPPVELLRGLYNDRRFNARNLNEGTIGPSPYEVRAFFQREEAIRYEIPERSFKYTTRNREKSSVAPLRNSEKATKARIHEILKDDRPPQFFVHSLVRDAAARLPGGKGTRKDVCTLMRDSQYVIEDVSDNRMAVAAIGALDRLHCEVDPCVEYDVTLGLWVYLHMDREEDDFTPDGTTSTKIRKRVLKC